jgi:hypothetical protein
MFAGHLAAGLVLKKMERRINLAWLFFAALFHDFLLGIFTLLGVERIVIPANYAQAHYMSFDFRYSHTLTASFVWSLLGFVVTYAVLSKWTSRERVQAGVAIGLTVFSHFVLDWIVHVPDLPLLGADMFKIGLGLWRNLGFALAFEVALVVFGFVHYLVVIKPKSNLSRYGLGGLLLFTTAMTVMGMWFATTPPPTMGAAMSWILQPFLICGLAYWFDKSF